MPHVVVRLYEDSGPLIGAIRERQPEVEDIMRGVPGFISYAIMDTGQGALSVTTCQDKSGTDESIVRAADWIKTNLPDAKIARPQIFEGDSLYRFVAPGMPTVGGNPHVVVRIFSTPPPQDVREGEARLREMMSDVPGWRAYTAVDLGSGGLTVLACNDKTAADEIGQRMRQYVEANHPERLTGAPPQIIEAQGVFRFEAQAAPV